MTNDSMEKIISDRLDELFGEDDEQVSIPQPSAEPAKSDLFTLREAVLELERRVGPESIERLTGAIRFLHKKQGKEPLFVPLLRMMYGFAVQLKPGRQEMNRAAVQLILSNMECLEYIDKNSALPLAAKRQRVQKEIESFKAFRETFKSPVPPETPAIPDSPPLTAHEMSAPLSEESGPLEAVSAEYAIPVQDQRAFAAEISEIKARLEEMAKTLEAQSNADRDMQKLLSSIEAGVGSLSTQQAEIRSSIVELLEGHLKRDHDALSGMPTELQGIRESVTDAAMGFEKLTGGLRQEIQFFQDSIRSLRSDLNNLELPTTLSMVQEESLPREEDTDTEVSLEKEEPLSLLDMSGEVVDAGLKTGQEEPPVEGLFHEEDTDTEVSLEKEDPLSPVEKPEDQEEIADVAEKSGNTPEDLSEPASGNYFLFVVGGKRYAVEERYVVKVSNAGPHLVKKAKADGGLTLSDSRTGLFSKRKGIEPAWRFMTIDEIKREQFRLVPESAIGGPADTEPKGVLYLGVGFMSETGNERIVLLTDHPAERTDLGSDEEARISETIENGSPWHSVLINRLGKPGESYSIISPEKLV